MLALIIAQAAVIPQAPQPRARFYQSDEPLPSDRRSCAELNKAMATQKRGRRLGSGWTAGGVAVDCRARLVTIDKLIAYPSTRQGRGWQAVYQREIDYVCNDWFVGGLIRRGWRFVTRTRFTDRPFSFTARCPARSGRAGR